MFPNIEGGLCSQLVMFHYSCIEYIGDVHADDEAQKLSHFLTQLMTKQLFEDQHEASPSDLRTPSSASLLIPIDATRQQ